MTVWGLWDGGHSYRVSEFGDAEPFDSIQHAVRVFRARLDGCDYAYPAVDASSTMRLFLGGHPDTYRDPYPDRVLTVGPRGGVNIERV